MGDGLEAQAICFFLWCVTAVDELVKNLHGAHGMTDGSEMCQDEMVVVQSGFNTRCTNVPNDNLESTFVGVGRGTCFDGQEAMGSRCSHFGCWGGTTTQYMLMNFGGEEVEGGQVEETSIV